MGLHILIENTEGRPADWDDLRYSNDVDFCRLMNDIDVIQHPKAEGYLFGHPVTSYEDHVRPRSIDALRDKIKHSGIENKERYFKLCGLLENDLDNWVIFSW